MPKDDTPDLGQIQTEIKAELKKIGDQVKEQGEKALAEAKKHGDMYAADKPKVDEMLVKQGELQARLLEVEQKMARQPRDEPSKPKSLGAQTVESEEYKKFLAEGGLVTSRSTFRKQFKAEITSTDDTSTRTVGVPPDMAPMVVLPQRRLTIRDLITSGTTQSNLIEYVRMSGFTNNAAPVSEAPTRKPESTLTFELVQAPVRTIAHFMKASKQILADFKALQSMIDRMLRVGLKKIEEDQILKGSGTGNNLDGIYTQATSYSAPIVVSSPTKIDTLRLMLLQVEIAGEELFSPNGIVLHPSDWAAIELTKDDNSRYLFANPQSLAQPSLWGRSVVPTTAMTEDTALVGDFAVGAQLFDREEISVVLATQNEDDFVRNMITILCEERLALAVYYPDAFVKNTNLPAT